MWSRCRSCERFANGVPDRGRNGQAAIRLVDALDNRPRRVDRAGQSQDAFAGRDELAVHLPVLPLLLRDVPAGQRIFFERLEPLLLGFSSQMHPELQDEGAVTRQRALECSDPVEPLVELARANSPVGAIDDRLRVPRAQKQPDTPFGWEVAPVSPVLGPLPFLV